MAIASSQELASTNQAIGSEPNVLYQDMNATTGGVARGTNIGSSFTKVYGITGEGLLYGFLINMLSINEATWSIRLNIDGVEIFRDATNGISFVDLLTNTLYDYNLFSSGGLGGAVPHHPVHMGFTFAESSIRWQGPLARPITYRSSVDIYLRKTGTTRAFRAGLALRSY